MQEISRFSDFSCIYRFMREIFLIFEKCKKCKKCDMREMKNEKNARNFVIREILFIAIHRSARKVLEMREK